METFLAASKNYLVNLKKYRNVKVILGNPTCDLDSAVCALVHGYFEYKEVARKNTEVAVIPVLNIAKKEFRLKTEVIYYLQRCDVSQDLLIFRNEIDLLDLQNSGKLHLVLVDHHALPTEDAQLAKSVVEIIDHRPQDAAWPWKERKLILNTTGSCATLIAQNILQHRPDVILTICKLLLGPILIDTVNFSKEANRATPLDYEMILQLDKLCGSDNLSRTKLYQDILNAKIDISNMTPDDLLIKDLKIINGIPIHGFPILVKDFLKLKDANQALKEFSTKNNYKVIILIGLDLKNEKVTRDIAVYSSSVHEVANKLIEVLTNSTNPNLQLTEAKRDDSAGKLLVLFKQDNVKVSRKQIVPIVQNALVGGEISDFKC